MVVLKVPVVVAPAAGAAGAGAGVAVAAVGAERTGAALPFLHVIGSVPAETVQDSFRVEKCNPLLDDSQS